MDRVSIVLTSREAAGGRIAGVTHVAGVEDGHGPIFDAGAFARQRTGLWVPQCSPLPTLSPASIREPHEPHRGRLHVAHVQQTGLALRVRAERLPCATAVLPSPTNLIEVIT